MSNVPVQKRASIFLRWGSFAAAAGIFLMLIMIGSPLIIFFDLTSVVVVVVGTICLLVWTYGEPPVQATVDVFKSMVWPRGYEALDADHLETGAEVARGAQRLTMLTGWAGMLIGSVQIIRGTILNEAASSPYIGPAVALTLLTLVYAVVMNMLLWVPLERYCTLALKRGADAPPFAPDDLPAPRPPATLKTRVGMALLILLALMVGMVSSYWISGLGK